MSEIGPHSGSLRRNFRLCDVICSTKHSLFYQVSACFGQEEIGTIALWLYPTISNLKRNITSGCSRLKLLSSVFSRSPLDCAREKCVFLFFMRFSFHLRTMRARKSIVNKSVYPRIKEHKTLALLYIVIFTKEFKNRAG